MKTSLVGLLIFLSSTAHAAASQAYFASSEERSNYLTIESVEVVEVPTDVSIQRRLEARLMPPVRVHAAGLNIDILDPENIDKYIAIGEKAWKMIAANKPVANVATSRISVLPKSHPDWKEMENWQTPTAKSYLLQAKNLYGVTVISHAYTIAYNYGGSLDGKGLYIANASVIPTGVDVAWGYTLNSRVEVGDPVNTGSKANPVPGINLQLIWSIDTVLKHSEGRDTFFIRGDGQTTRI